MHLFLKGPRGAGKSTLLREVLLPYQDRLAGFVVQRLRKSGRPAGFRAVLLNGVLPPLETEFEEGMGGVFILDGRKDGSVLDGIIAQVEADSQKSGRKLMLLDEIGGLELTSPQFMEPLLSILSRDTPCIGVLKSQENLEHTASVLNLGESALVLRARLESRIASNGQILEFSRGKEKICRDALNAVVKSSLLHGQTALPGDNP